MKSITGTDGAVAEDELGPVDLLVIEFPDRRAAAGSLPPLIQLVDGGLIRVLDLVVIRKDQEGAITRVELGNVAQHGQPALVAFDGASSGILDGGDIDQTARVMQPGSSAALLLYEHRWAEPLMTSIRRTGAQILANERIATEAVLAALDASDAR